MSSSNLTDSFVQEELTDSTLLQPSLSNLSSTSSFQLTNIANQIIANQIVSVNRNPSPGYAFNVSDPAPPHFHLIPTFQNMAANNYGYPTYFMIRNNPCEEEGSEEEYDRESFVSEKLIAKWNSEIGNAKNYQKAKKLIQKMRKLGGLDPSTSEDPIDIPSARMGLCLLAGLDNQSNKMEALTSLLEVLKKDNYSRSNSNRLVTLATALLNLMAREVIQAVDLDAQNKMAEVYNVLAETLHYHFGKGHINGITKELKDLLIQAPQSLEKLNRLEDAKLKFNVNCAFEGVHRLKDDRQELFELVERIYHLAAAATSLYLQDAQAGFPYLEKAFKDIHTHLPNSWYNGVLVLKGLAKNVKDNPEQLTPLFILIGKKFKKLNWKFTYAAIEILFNFALNGENAAIRLRAFNGIKQLGYHFPGLAHFASCSELDKYTSLKPMTHLELPHQVDPNIRIRKACIERLMELVEKSQDSNIVRKSQSILENRLKAEKDPEILQLLENGSPLSSSTLDTILEDDVTETPILASKIRRHPI